MKSYLLLITALLPNLASLYLYHNIGFKLHVFSLWLLSIILAAAFIRYQNKQKKTTSSFSKKDLLIAVFLLGIFLPLYTIGIYNIPHQINTDEIHIGNYFQQAVTIKKLDLFGLSDYFDFPFGVFYFYGFIEKTLGGFDFFHARLAHAIVGAFIVVPCYMLFRAFYTVFWALIATVLVMTNHSLFAISRMVSRNNFLLFNAVLAYLLLFLGLKNGSVFLSFVGGVAAGVSFYQYQPAMVIFPLWLFFLGIFWLLKRQGLNLSILKLGLAATIGFVFTISPSIVAYSKLDNPQNYGRKQILLYPEGRIYQQNWYSATNIEEGMKQNIKNSLLMFNTAIPDQAYIYQNNKSGFLDNITGMLLWLGIAAVVVKRGKKFYDWFFLSGFFFLWFIYTFISNLTPNYTRMLIILPFVAFFVVEFLKATPRLLDYLKANQTVKTSLICFIVAWVIISNFLIFAYFDKRGRLPGNDVGSTGRYIQSRKNIPNYTFYLVASPAYPYYSWGIESQWQTWAEFFLRPNQNLILLQPDEILAYNMKPPFTILTPQSAWKTFGIQILKLYPNAQIENIKKDGSLIAIDVTH